MPPAVGCYSFQACHKSASFETRIGTELKDVREKYVPDEDAFGDAPDDRGVHNVQYTRCIMFRAHSSILNRWLFVLASELRVLPRSLVSTSPAVILVSVCFSLPPVPANAAEYGALVKFTNNYVYQGYSKSNGDPVLQGNIDVEYSAGIFTGFWISQVDFNYGHGNSQASVELSPYLGWGASLNNWSLDSTVAGYIYDGKVNGRAAHYGELSGRVHFRDLVTAQISISPNVYGTSNSILDYELLGRFPLNDILDVSAGIGYSNGNNRLGYDSCYYNIGATWFLRRYAAVDLRYYDQRRRGEEPQGFREAGFELPPIENHIVVSFSLGF